MEEANQCILVVMGATADGKKELVALTDGFRESEQSWKDGLLDMKRRGLRHDPQLTIGEVRVPLLMKPGAPAKADGEYVKAGTCNLFVALEPKGGRRSAAVTDRRAKVDFVAFIEHLLNDVYATPQRVHLVVDNLNTRFRVCFEQVLGVDAAKALLRRVVFHYTPTHGSWLNMADMEIGIRDRQCLDRRLPDRILLTAQVATWEQRRNAEQRCIAWTFTQ